MPDIQSFDHTLSIMLDEEMQMIQQSALDFSSQLLYPKAHLWDSEGMFDYDIIKEAADMGFLGLSVSEEYNGMNLPRLANSVVYEALSMGCISTASYISIHNMNASMLNQYGSDDIKEKYLKPMVAGELFSSYCLTEPGSGSDAKAMKTFAEDKGDHFVVNGSKCFISGAGYSDLYVTMLKTSEKDVSCLLIDKDMDGVSFGEKEQKMGWRASPTAMVFFDNVKVPKSNLLGVEGKGFNYAMNELNGGRISIGSCALGGATLAMGIATEYSLSRKAFNTPVFEFKKDDLADSYSKLVSSRILLRQACLEYESNKESRALLCAAAKLRSTEDCREVVDKCLQVLGGYGYLSDYVIERILRDMRVHTILEGTSEIMKVIISRHMKN